MFNAQELLGSLMSAGTSGSASGRMQHALGARGLGGSDGILGQLLAGLGGAQGGDLLRDLANMANGMAGDAKRSVSSGNPLALGGLGALAGSLLGGGGGSLKGALGGGALALLGSIAFDALRKSNAGTSASASIDPNELPVGVREPANADERQGLESKASLMVAAMVNAAKADGRIDDNELDRIVGKLEQQGADIEARNHVRQLLQAPMDTDRLVNAVTDAQTAGEVYAASILAIAVDTDAERRYLADLAQRLGLSREAAARIHALLGVA